MQLIPPKSRQAFLVPTYIGLSRYSGRLFWGGGGLTTPTALGITEVWGLARLPRRSFFFFFVHAQLRRGEPPFIAIMDYYIGYKVWKSGNFGLPRAFYQYADKGNTKNCPKHYFRP